MKSAVAMVIFVFVTSWIFAVWLQRTLHHARDVRAVQWTAPTAAVHPAPMATRPALESEAQSSKPARAAMERASRRP